MLGMDFPDALQLASRGESTKFVTFDEKLVKRAKALGALSVQWDGAVRRQSGRVKRPKAPQRARR